MLTRCDKFHYWNRAARCGYRTRASDFTQCVLFRRRTRCSFVLFHPSVYNGTLQDQSSSHLSAVLEMPDRYFTARPRFVREIFFSFVFVRAEASPSRRFLLSTFSFSQKRWCESLVCLAMIIRSDRGRFPPGGANSTVRDCSASISSSAVLRPLSTNHLFVWASALIAVRFSGTSVSQSGNLFVPNVQPL